MFKTRLLAALAMTGMTLLGASSSFAAPPEIIAGKNREAEVIFKDNNCVVYFNRHGVRGKSLPSCRTRQIHRADKAMDAYRREQGWNDAGGEPPQIIAGKNREAEVIFKGNNCVVYYNRRGRRKSSLPACRHRQLSRADKAIAGFRREQGW